MREWTLEERYRVLEDKEQIRDLYENIQKSKYRQFYHVQPVTGLSSDPNGFVFHDGTWHLFFQWCPWGAVHGLKYWYHVTSKDLVHWKNEGIGMAPDTFYDNKGCHSGSAISENGDLYFFYTGNHRDENWVRTPYSCAAKLVDGKPKKLEKPLFGPREGYSEHQRDPKVFFVEEKGLYYIFIGAQNNDLQGRVLVYKSEELLKGWEFAGELTVPGFEDFGGMWECPCIEKLNGKDVLIFSPQYTKLPNRGESTNHNVYMIGKMDYDTLTFTPEGGYKYLDYGFDFYAAQLAPNVGSDEKATIIAWIGLPDNHYPTEEEDWEGSMIVPRELRLKGDVLYQTPVEAVKDLRLDPVKGDVLPNVCDIELEFKPGDAKIALFTKADGKDGLTIDYDEKTKTFTVDKSKMDKRFNEKIFEVLEMPIQSELKKMRILIDRSSVEIFVNGGEETFTMHLYPTERETGFVLSDNVKAVIYPLEKAATDEFVV